MAGKLYYPCEEGVGGLGWYYAVFPQSLDLLLDVVDQTRVLLVLYQHLSARHGLLFAKRLIDLLQDLVDSLLLLQQLLAHLILRIRVQTLANVRQAVLGIAEGVKGDGRHLDPRRDVAWPQVGDVVEVADALLYLALVEPARRAQLPQRQVPVGHQDGHAGVLHAVVPVLLLCGRLGQLGGAHGLEQLVHLARLAGRLARSLVVLECAVPVRGALLDLGELQVSALEAGPELEDLVVALGGVGQASGAQVGGGALKVRHVVLGVAGDGGVVVDQGVVGLAAREVRLRCGEELRDGQITGNLVGGYRGGQPGARG